MIIPFELLAAGISVTHYKQFSANFVIFTIFSSEIVRSSENAKQNSWRLSSLEKSYCLIQVGAYSCSRVGKKLTECPKKCEVYSHSKYAGSSSHLFVITVITLNRSQYLTFDYRFLLFFNVVYLISIVWLTLLTMCFMKAVITIVAATPY